MDKNGKNTYAKYRFDYFLWLIFTTCSFIVLHNMGAHIAVPILLSVVFVMEIIIIKTVKHCKNTKKGVNT